MTVTSVTVTVCKGLSRLPPKIPYCFRLLSALLLQRAIRIGPPLESGEVVSSEHRAHESNPSQGVLLVMRAFIMYGRVTGIYMPFPNTCRHTTRRAMSRTP